MKLINLSPMLNIDSKLKDTIESVANDKLPIIEFFKTLEGEGLNIGKPKILVRVGGCLVGCSNCDTKYSWGLNHASMYHLTDLASKLLEFNDNWCSEYALTGGEPLHFSNQILSLIPLLKKQGMQVSMETSGLIDAPSIFKMLDFISFDIKTPSTGIELTQKNIQFLNSVYDKYNCQIKAVVTDITDLIFLETHFMPLLIDKNFPLVITPAAGKFNSAPEILLKTELIRNWNKQYNIRVIAQQHQLLSYA